MPAVELRNLASAALDGARTVMLEAPPNADTRTGWVESSADVLLLRGTEWT
jgi:hypothetical protein